MPRIYDNIEQKLLPALCDALEPATHADFCVGYFNLVAQLKHASGNPTGTIHALVSTFK